MWHWFSFVWHCFGLVWYCFGLVWHYFSLVWHIFSLIRHSLFSTELPHIKRTKQQSTICHWLYLSFYSCVLIHCFSYFRNQGSRISDSTLCTSFEDLKKLVSESKAESHSSTTLKVIDIRPLAKIVFHLS